MPGMPGPSQPVYCVAEAIPPARPSSRPTWPSHYGLVDQGYREVAAWGGDKTETELVLRESWLASFALLFTVTALLAVPCKGVMSLMWRGGWIRRLVGQAPLHADLMPSPKWVVDWPTSAPHNWGHNLDTNVSSDFIRPLLFKPFVLDLDTATPTSGFPCAVCLWQECSSLPCCS